VELVSLVLAVAAIGLTVSIELLKRPSLEVRAIIWQPREPVAWTFAAVRVFNRPLPGFLRTMIVRAPAQCCEVTLEFREPGRDYIVIPLVPARWSSQPEPLRSVMVTDDGGSPSFVVQYDRTMVPQTKRLDLAAGEDGEEVAVAVQRADGSAHAFGAESYEFENWSNPNWELRRQVYEVTVHITASGLTHSRRFRLDNTAPDFARFTALVRA